MNSKAACTFSMNYSQKRLHVITKKERKGLVMMMMGEEVQWINNKKFAEPEWNEEKLSNPLASAVFACWRRRAGNLRDGISFPKSADVSSVGEFLIVLAFRTTVYQHNWYTIDTGKRVWLARVLFSDCFLLPDCSPNLSLNLLLRCCFACRTRLSC